LILFETILRRPGHVDERDKLILGKAPRFQWLAVIFSLVAWVIALSERYHDEGVPVVFLYLIFMSVLIVSMIAQAVGILIGYRRMR